VREHAEPGARRAAGAGAGSDRSRRERPQPARRPADAEAHELIGQRVGQLVPLEIGVGRTALGRTAVAVLIVDAPISSTGIARSCSLRFMTRRSGSEIRQRGIDAYLERHQLPDALDRSARALRHPARGRRAAATLAPRRSLRLPLRARRAPGSACSRTSGRAPPARVLPHPGARRCGCAAPAASPEVEKAQRLARIIVSDVILYNAESSRPPCVQATS